MIHSVNGEACRRLYKLRGLLFRPCSLEFQFRSRLSYRIQVQITVKVLRINGGQNDPKWLLFEAILSFETSAFLRAWIRPESFRSFKLFCDSLDPGRTPEWSICSRK